MNAVYRDMAKKVHPDMNGGSATATERMKEVNKHKNSPSILIRLARQWGLKLDGTFSNTVFENMADAQRSQVYETVVGAIIKDIKRYNFGRSWRAVRGVITKIRTIGKGRYAGYTEYTIYDFVTGKPYLRKFHPTNINPFNTPVGKADIKDINLALNSIKQQKVAKKVKAKVAQGIADTKFANIGIKKNTNYKNKGVRILINYRGGRMWKEVVRTTAKSVFVYETDYSK